MKLIYDNKAQCLVGHTGVDDEAGPGNGDCVLLPVPEGFDVAALQTYEQFTLVEGQLVQDAGRYLARMKQVYIGAVRSHFNALVERIKADCAQYEVQTWDVQRSEYVAWSADKKAPTPYCSALAQARGLTLDDLMGRIAGKVSTLAGLQGRQQAMETRLAGAASVDALRALLTSLDSLASLNAPGA